MSCLKEDGVDGVSEYNIVTFHDDEASVGS